VESVPAGTNQSRVALAAAVPLLPFAAAVVMSNLYVFVFAPVLAAVMIRVVGSWRRWAWVVAAVAVGTALWGGFTWWQLNAACVDQGPVLPAALAAICVLAGTLVGAAVAGLNGSRLRLVVGAVAAGVTTALAFAVWVLLGAALGIPTLLGVPTHC